MKKPSAVSNSNMKRTKSSLLSKKKNMKKNTGMWSEGDGEKEEKGGQLSSSERDASYDKP